MFRLQIPHRESISLLAKPVADRVIQAVFLDSGYELKDITNLDYTIAIGDEANHEEVVTFTVNQPVQSVIKGYWLQHQDVMAFQLIDLAYETPVGHTPPITHAPAPSIGSVIDTQFVNPEPEVSANVPQQLLSPLRQTTEPPARPTPGGRETRAIMFDT